jgi:hypothetical protein
VLSQLQFLQGKSYELACLQTVGDCFRLLSQVARELFAFDRCSLLSYQAQTAPHLTRLLPSSDKSEEEQIVLQVEDQRGEPLVMDLLGAMITQQEGGMG